MREGAGRTQKRRDLFANHSPLEGESQKVKRYPRKGAKRLSTKGHEERQRATKGLAEDPEGGAKGRVRGRRYPRRAKREKELSTKEPKGLEKARKGCVKGHEGPKISTKGHEGPRSYTKENQKDSPRAPLPNHSPLEGEVAEAAGLPLANHSPLEGESQKLSRQAKADAVGGWTPGLRWGGGRRLMGRWGVATPGRFST